MSSDTKLMKDEECESVDSTKYRGMISSLLYLTTSRPDIMFSVCLCARFQEDPKTSHLEVDVFNIVSVLSRKQPILLYPRTTAEYEVAKKACQHALWMKLALIDYDIRLDNVPIMCDNKGVVLDPLLRYIFVIVRQSCQKCSFEEVLVHKRLWKTLTHVLKLSSCIYLCRLSMRSRILTRHGLEAATVGKPASIDFKRISLTGFRSCASRSCYRSVSKQTTRLINLESCKSPTKSLFDVGSRRISIVIVNTKEYHSDCPGYYNKDNAFRILKPNVV
ncbi:hypothetical protein Tco_1108692 [Tanacetum coccineum]